MLRFEETLLVGENDSGYEFGVGRIGDEWIGFAKCGHALWWFTMQAPRGRLGVPDRDEAIRQTHAYATAPENGYGGITRWFVQEDLRGDADAYRCPRCGAVFCNGECEKYEHLG